MTTSPGGDARAVDDFLRATTPTANPARSYSPARVHPGQLGRLAAEQAQPLSLHAAAMPATTFSATATSSLPVAK